MIGHLHRRIILPLTVLFTLTLPVLKPYSTTRFLVSQALVELGTNTALTVDQRLTQSRRTLKKTME